MASNPRKRRQPCSRSRRNRINARNTLQFLPHQCSSGRQLCRGGLLQVVRMPPHLQPHTQLRLPQQGQHPGPPELHLQGLRLQLKYHFNGAQPYEFLLARKDMIVNIFFIYTYGFWFQTRNRKFYLNGEEIRCNGLGFWVFQLVFWRLALLACRVWGWGFGDGNRGWLRKNLVK